MHATRLYLEESELSLLVHGYGLFYMHLREVETQNSVVCPLLSSDEIDN